MKIGSGRLAASIVAFAGIGMSGCSSTGPDIPTLYGYITATIDGVAWQSRRQWPDPPVDSTIVAVYVPSTGRLWISGNGNSPPAGGVVEQLSLCVPSGGGQGRFALGPRGAGPFGYWEPADTSVATVSHYFSGAPPGTLTIEDYDPAGGTIRGGFTFQGHQDNGSKTLPIAGRFYGHLVEGLDSQISQLCQ